MYVSRENERLYLDSWEYNAARVLARIEKMVSDNGGTVIVRDYNRIALVSDRTLDECIKKAQDNCDKVRAALESHYDDGRDDARRTYLAENVKKLEQYKRIDNTPIRCRWFTYISFVLDGVYYSINLDDNPFFPFTYKKIRLDNDNCYRGDYYAEQLNKAWLFSSLYRCGCSEDDIKEAACMLYNSLLNGKFSGRAAAEKERRRVANTYNDGWHYETIVKPGRVHRPLVSAID